MIVDVLIHWALELGGSGAWACLRRRCKHRHHRIGLDLALTLVASVLVVRWLG